MMPWCNNKSLSSTPPHPTTSMSPSWTSTSLSTSQTDPYQSLIFIYNLNIKTLSPSSPSTYPLTTTKTRTSSTTKTTTPPTHTQIPTKLNKYQTKKKDPLPKAPKQRTSASTSAKRPSRWWKPEFIARNCRKYLQSTGKHRKRWSRRSWK